MVKTRKVRAREELATGDARAERLAELVGVYLAIRYTERLDAAGAVRSVGSKGDSYDCETAACRSAA